MFSEYMNTRITWILILVLVSAPGSGSAVEDLSVACFRAPVVTCASLAYTSRCVLRRTRKGRWLAAVVKTSAYKQSMHR